MVTLIWRRFINHLTNIWDLTGPFVDLSSFSSTHMLSWFDFSSVITRFDLPVLWHEHNSAFLHLCKLISCESSTECKCFCIVYYGSITKERKYAKLLQARLVDFPVCLWRSTSRVLGVLSSGSHIAIWMFHWNTIIALMLFFIDAYCVPQHI